MTVPPVRRRLPEKATVVDVDGSRFLLEWLDMGVLAAMISARPTGLLSHAAGSRSADR
jgi:hypothetical protein